MFYLTDEERIILLSSRLNPSLEDLASIENLVKHTSKEINYNKLVYLAFLNGVAPLLYKNLKQTDIIPLHVMTKLKDIYLLTIAKNFANLKETIKIVRLLRANKIEVIPLKGSLASEIIFKDSGLYAASDIDILVKPGELEEIKRIFINNGFRYYDEKREKDMFLSHYHLGFYDGRHVIEVHWNLVKRYFNIAPEFWWDGVFITQYNDEDILCLSHEKYVMYTIFRLFSHEFSYLKFFVLISELTNKYYHKIDWNDFVALSSRYRMKRLNAFTLKLMNELFNIKIPDQLLKKKIYSYNVLKKTIIKGLFKKSKRTHIKKILFLLLLDTPLDILRVFFRRIFPTAGELRLRYKVPEGSKKIYLYYILNPFLLPLLLLKKHDLNRIIHSKNDNNTELKS